jgi:hypothetical protein
MNTFLRYTRKGLIPGFTLLLSLLVSGCSGDTVALEQEIQGLKAQIEKNARQIQRMEDINAIQNLMGKMDNLYEAGMYEERMAYIAEKTPGVTMEVGARGVFEGYESIRRSLVDTEYYYEKSHGAGMRNLFPGIDFPSDFAGKYESNLLGTPVIEIAGDGKTAKGVWTSLMTVGKTHENDPEMSALWIWWKIGGDFVKEDGRWKIWHYVKNPVYATNYSTSWVDSAVARATGAGFGPGGAPLAQGVGGKNAMDTDQEAMPSSGGATLDSRGNVTPSHGTTADRPTSELYWSYGITKEAQLVPKPPEPYETFDEKDAYVYPSIARTEAAP